MANSKPNKPYVRLATPAEFDEFVDVAFKAFITDPVYNYFGTVNKLLNPEKDVKACKTRRKMLTFLTKACYLVGGRITVVVEKEESSDKERILSGCLWLPPHKRLEVWMVYTIVKAGIIPVLKGWGVNGFMRIVFDYQGTVEKKMKEVFKAGNAKVSTENSWYLQLAFTAPEHEGKGLLSLLVREQLALTPDEIIVLEATTPTSRDIYLHLGFENPVSVIFGKGKADGRGITAEGSEASGVECWAMAKWPAKPTNS